MYVNSSIFPKREISGDHICAHHFVSISAIVVPKTMNTIFFICSIIEYLRFFQKNHKKICLRTIDPLKEEEKIDKSI